MWEALKLEDLLPLLSAGMELRVYFRDTNHAAGIPSNKKYSDGTVVLVKDEATGEERLGFDYKLKDGIQDKDLGIFTWFRILN